MDIIVPAKKFTEAKSRLAGVLPAADREKLAELLAVTVLRQLARVRCVRRVIVASSEPSLVGIASEFGFDILADDPLNRGLNASVGRAVRHAMSTGAQDVGIVFSDLPLFWADEFEEIVRRHLAGAPRQVTLVRDRFGMGTNVRLCRPGDLLPPLYGRNSASEYQKAAVACGAELLVVESDRLSHDLDQPADIDAIFDLEHGRLLPSAFHATFKGWVGCDVSRRQDKCA
jgi:2-phospho-L-lactate guanylyltransferase